MTIHREIVDLPDIFSCDEAETFRTAAKTSACSRFSNHRPKTKVLCAALLLVIILSISTGIHAAPLHPARLNAENYFNQAEMAQGKSYATTRRNLFIASIVIQMTILLILLWSRAGLQFRLWSAISAKGRYWVMTFWMTLGTVVPIKMALLPIHFFEGYILQHRYSLSNQSMSSWFYDWLLTSGIELLVFVMSILLIYRLIACCPKSWWLPSSIVLSVGMCFIFWLNPVLIDPLFNEFRPLDDDTLERQVKELAQRAGIPLSQVLVMDASSRTRRGNAYFTGLRDTKRITLFDTLVECFSRKEVLSVIAHELGHWRHQHVAKGLLLGCLGIFAALFITSRTLLKICGRGYFGLREPADPATLPFILLVFLVLQLAAMPLENAVSREFERQADDFAIELTKDPQSFISVEQKLARMNLCEIHPPRWAVLLFYTHPPVLERISRALEFKQMPGVEYQR